MNVVVVDVNTTIHDTWMWKREKEMKQTNETDETNETIRL